MSEKISFNVRNGKLFVEGHLIPFDYDVRDSERAIVQVTDKLLVALNPTRHHGGIKIPIEKRCPEDKGRNAYAVDRNGHILWQAEANKKKHQYLAFQVIDDRNVRAIFDWDIVIPIDVETGKLIYSPTTE